MRAYSMDLCERVLRDSDAGMQAADHPQISSVLARKEVGNGTSPRDVPQCPGSKFLIERSEALREALHDRTAGIVGTGTIGTVVARILLGFG